MILSINSLLQNLPPEDLILDIFALSNKFNHMNLRLNISMHILYSVPFTFPITELEKFLNNKRILRLRIISLIVVTLVSYSIVIQ